MVRVDADFQDEYPGGDTTCTEAYASLCRTGEALLGELDRRIVLTFDMHQAAATALAVIDGAAAPLTPSQVSNRVLIPSATMTATLDLLERRGWIRRTPNPGDRRSVLVEITPDGRAAADQLLPGIRAVERSILSALTQDERALLLGLLAKVLARAAEVAAEPPEPLKGQRASGRPGSTAPGQAPNLALSAPSGPTDRCPVRLAVCLPSCASASPGCSPGQPLRISPRPRPVPAGCRHYDRTGQANSAVLTMSCQST